MAIYNAKYNNVYKTDKGLAKLVYNNTDVRCYSEDAVDKQIAWIMNNCENVTDLAIENALQTCWYDFIGISNNSLWKEISTKVEALADEKKIIPWIYDYE